MRSRPPTPTRPASTEMVDLVGKPLTSHDFVLTEPRQKLIADLDTRLGREIGRPLSEAEFTARFDEAASARGAGADDAQMTSASMPQPYRLRCGCVGLAGGSALHFGHCLNVQRARRAAWLRLHCRHESTAIGCREDAAAQDFFDPSFVPTPADMASAASSRGSALQRS